MRLVLLSLIGQFRHHNAVTVAAHLFDVGTRLDAEVAAARCVGFDDHVLVAVVAIENAAGGKVRPLDEDRSGLPPSHRRRGRSCPARRTSASHTSLRLCGGTLVVMPTAMPLAPLTSRLGKAAGSTLGSSSESSKLGRKSTVSLSQIGHQRVGHRVQARLGVAHGSRVVAVDGAEVALPVDQHVAQAEVLRHTHHGVVDGGVAVRMVLAQHLADDTRPTSCAACCWSAPCPASRRGCGDGPASARRAHRAAHAPR